MVEFSLIAVYHQFEISLCPALQYKPSLPTPHFDPTVDGGLGVQGNKGRTFDPFEPPYNPNLYVGELRDEEEGVEYVVLVSMHIQ